MNTDTATFAAGCFWGVQDGFDMIDGVIKTTVGYTGGHTKNPTYEDVCSHSTGHAEAVEVQYDPSKISYEKLLETFFNMHNPTTLNKQGPDVGDNYRSAIFYHNEKQKKSAEEYKLKLNESGKYGDPVVTEISPASAFYRAEEYHQKYFQKHGVSACHI